MCRASQIMVKCIPLKLGLREILSCMDKQGKVRRHFFTAALDPARIKMWGKQKFSWEKYMHTYSYHNTLHSTLFLVAANFNPCSRGHTIIMHTKFQTYTSIIEVENWSAKLHPPLLPKNVHYFFFCMYGLMNTQVSFTPNFRL